MGRVIYVRDISKLMYNEIVKAGNENTYTRLYHYSKKYVFKMFIAQNDLSEKNIRILKGILSERHYLADIHELALPLKCVY